MSLEIFLIIDFQLLRNWTSSEESSFAYLMELVYDVVYELFFKVKPSILQNIAISLINLKDVIAEKRSKLANRRDHHDNAKPHVALTIKIITV